jgi:hypothetical protein
MAAYQHLREVGSSSRTSSVVSAAILMLVLLFALCLLATKPSSAACGQIPFHPQRWRPFWTRFPNGNRGTPHQQYPPHLHRLAGKRPEELPSFDLELAADMRPPGSILTVGDAGANDRRFALQSLFRPPHLGLQFNQVVAAHMLQFDVLEVVPNACPRGLSIWSPPSGIYLQAYARSFPLLTACVYWGSSQSREVPR